MAKLWVHHTYIYDVMEWLSGPQFTKRVDVLPQDLVNDPSREIRI